VEGGCWFLFKWVDFFALDRDHGQEYKPPFLLDDCRKPLTSKYGMTRQLQLKRGILLRWRSTTKLRLWPENRALMCRALLLPLAACLLACLLHQKFSRCSTIPVEWPRLQSPKSCCLHASWSSLCILVWH
jgi:hypothetical protein